MKKLILALFLLPVFVFAQKTAVKPELKKSGFVVTGTVTGVVEGTTIKLVNANDNSDMAAGKITNGKFTLNGVVTEPILARIFIGNEPPQYIYLENKKITVNGSKSDLQHLKISGSDSHNDFQQFQKIFTPLFTTLNTTGNNVNKAVDQQQYDSIMKNYESIKATIQKEIDAYIKTRSKSYLSPFLLFATAEMYDDVMLLENRYNSLHSSIKKSEIGQNLASYIQYNKVGAIGTPAIDFTQPDTLGKAVSLSSFRGKYVLVDFWASWCGPCRAENPNLVDNYKYFKDKNFTVLGVSLDKEDGKNNWLAAIQHDSLTWTHVSDLKHWNNAAAQLYRVQSIPYNFLVDPNGKIIAKKLRGQALRTKLCELLGGCN